MPSSEPAAKQNTFTDHERFALKRLAADYAWGENRLMALTGGRPAASPKPERPAGKGSRLAVMILSCAALALMLSFCIAKAIREIPEPRSFPARGSAQTGTVLPERFARPAEETPEGTLRISTATAEQLTALPGIGPVLAQRIVDEQQARGAFYYPEDLLSVNGIGPKLLERIRPYLLFDPEESLP